MEVTEKAKQHLTDLLASVKADSGSETCFRIVEDGDAFRLEVGVPEASDRTITAGGETVLAIDAAIVDKVENMTLDVDTSQKSQARLMLLPTPGD